VLEKESKLGGNSAKASTGISALTPEKGDTEAAYIQDTMASGQGFSQETLVDTLVVSSPLLPSKWTWVCGGMSSQ
jgi:aspartate oxidase